MINECHEEKYQGQELAHYYGTPYGPTNIKHISYFEGEKKKERFTSLTVNTNDVK